MSIDDIKHYTDLCRAGDTTITERRILFETHRDKVLDNMKKVRKMLKTIEYKIELYKNFEKK